MFDKQELLAVFLIIFSTIGAIGMIVFMVSSRHRRGSPNPPKSPVSDAPPEPTPYTFPEQEPQNKPPKPAQAKPENKRKSPLPEDFESFLNSLQDDLNKPA